MHFLYKAAKSNTINLVLAFWTMIVGLITKQQSREQEIRFKRFIPTETYIQQYFSGAGNQGGIQKNTLALSNYQLLPTRTPETYIHTQQTHRSHKTLLQRRMTTMCREGIYFALFATHTNDLINIIGFI